MPEFSSYFCFTLVQLTFSNTNFKLSLWAIVTQDSGVGANLRGISAVSDIVVWASGENGTIVRTLDGGEHWEKVTTYAKTIYLTIFGTHITSA